MTNKVDVALQNLLEALRLAPNNPRAYLDLGKFHYYQGQIKQAIPLFEKSLRLDPDATEAHFHLANSFIRMDMVQQAITHYQAVIAKNSHHSDAKLNLAMAWVSLGNYTDALPYLTEAAALDPFNSELQGHLAEAYVDLGQTSNAIAQFEKAISLEPNRAAWHHNLAVLYLRAKNSSAAQQHFKICLELEPNNPTAEHLLKSLSQEDISNNESTEAPAEYVSALFDQYANYYNAHMRDVLKYDVPVALRHAVGKALGIHIKAQNVLDLGCGTGLCGIYFRDMADFLVGVDLSYEMLQQAKVLGAYDGLCQSNILDSIPGYERHVFDVVIAADVLVYIGDLADVFKAVKAASRNKSLFAFSVETSSDDRDYTLLASGRYAHTSTYIEKLADKFDFKIESIEDVILREQEHIPVQGKLYVLILQDI